MEDYNDTNVNQEENFDEMYSSIARRDSFRSMTTYGRKSTVVDDGGIVRKNTAVPMAEVINDVGSNKKASVNEIVILNDMVNRLF